MYVLTNHNGKFWSGKSFFSEEFPNAKMIYTKEEAKKEALKLSSLIQDTVNVMVDPGLDSEEVVVTIDFHDFLNKP